MSKKPRVVTFRLEITGTNCTVLEAMAAFLCSMSGDCYPYEGDFPDLDIAPTSAACKKLWRHAQQDIAEVTQASIGAD